jgi:hypothetical protein
MNANQYLEVSEFLDGLQELLVDHGLTLTGSMLVHVAGDIESDVEICRTVSENDYWWLEANEIY